MKILFCNLFESYTARAIQKYLKKSGVICVEKTYYTPEDLYGDDRIDKMLEKDIKLVRPDSVWTINFWPPVARVCKKHSIKYISYGYDSPQNIPSIENMEFDTNYIFLFDRDETQKYQKKGIHRVFHAPLATDLEQWDGIKESKVSYDISLVGSIYESTLPDLVAGMDEYHKGFFQGVVLAQQNVYGYYMVDELIEPLIENINKCYKKINKNAHYVTLPEFSYSVGSYITYLDRITLLRCLQLAGEVSLFTTNISTNNKKLLDGVKIFGKVDYQSEMPKVFKSTKINLNPILRVIRSGIPQRALDVMGCKGFLLSSYQPELAEFFLADEEMVMYESYDDALAKAKFYLKNDDIRENIAVNGYRKIEQFFTYDVRLKEIMEIAGEI